MMNEIVFHKYFGSGKEYLVYDVHKNSMELNDRVIRKLHNRNFGLGLDGILVGPFMNDDGIEMKLYNPDGGECIQAQKGAEIFSKYLKDQGYVKQDAFVLHTAEGDVAIEKDMTDGIEAQMANGELCQSRIYWWC